MERLDCGGILEAFESLAMKLSALRDDVDIEDARLLLAHSGGEREELWPKIEPHLVPERELKAWFAFENLWPRMDLLELVRAVRTYDALAAREWVAAAIRDQVCATDLRRPSTEDALDLAIAAGLAECSRAAGSNHLLNGPETCRLLLRTAIS